MSRRVSPYLLAGAVIAGILLWAGFTDLGMWLLSALIGGAVLSAIGVAITKDIKTALPFAAGGAALGISVQVFLRIQMWFG